MRYQDWVESITLQDYNTVSERVKVNGKLLHACFGVSGEAGELLDAVKKHIFYGKELDRANIVEELGDILFYVAMACNAMNLTIEDIIKSNVEKLSKRYPSGFFSEEQARQRLDKKD